MTGSFLRAVPMLVFAALLPEGWGLCLPASVPVRRFSLFSALSDWSPRKKIVST